MPETTTAGDGSQASAASASQTATTTTATTAQAAQPAAITAEQLLAASAFKLSPQDELETVKQSYAASSREAQRLNATVKSVNSLLESQGLKAVVDKKTGEIKGFEPTDKYESELPQLRLSKKLLKEVAEKLSDDPDGAMELLESRVADDVRRSIVRPKPTQTQPAETAEHFDMPEANQLSAALDYVGSKKMEIGGDARYENFDKIKPVLQQMIPQLPAELQSAIANPRSRQFMLEMLADRLALTQLRGLAAAQKMLAEKTGKTQQTATTAATSPSNSGNVSVNDGNKGDQIPAEHDHYASLMGKPL